MQSMRNFYLILKKLMMISLVCVFFTVVSFDTYVYGDYEKNEEYTYVNSIKELVREFYPDINPEIDNITYIYSDYEICEIAFDIISNEIDYGYVIIDCKSKSISQFVIKEDTDGFCVQNFGRLPEEDEKIVKSGTLDYEIASDNLAIKYVASKSNNINDDLFDIFIDDFPDPMYVNFKMSCKTIGRYCRITEGELDELGLRFCCGSVAILNICGAYGLFDKTDDTQLQKAYKKIWGYCNIKYQDEEYTMPQGQMGKALAKYYKSVTGKQIKYTEKNNPKIDFFTEAVDKKYSTILGVYSREDDGLYGHAVSVEGYFVFEPLNEQAYGERQIFLQVASGWEKEARYIWYDKVNLDSTYGVKYFK